MSTFTESLPQLKRIGGTQWKVRELYDAASAADDGEWISTAGMCYCNFLVSWTITAGTVSFAGWNGNSAPDATENGEPVYGIFTNAHTRIKELTEVTGDGLVSFPRETLPTFIKCYISDDTNITSIDVDMKAVYET